MVYIKDNRTPPLFLPIPLLFFEVPQSNLLEKEAYFKMVARALMRP